MKFQPDLETASVNSSRKKRWNLAKFFIFLVQVHMFTSFDGYRLAVMLQGSFFRLVGR